MADDSAQMIPFLEPSQICYVMNQGFFSQENLDSLLDHHIQFLIAIPDSTSPALSLVKKYRNEITDYKHGIILDQNDVLYGVTEKSVWKGYECWVHLFYDALRAANEQNALFKEIYAIKTRYLQAETRNSNLTEETEKYFSIEKDENNQEKLIGKTDIIQSKLENEYGWIAALSNRVESAQEVIEIFNRKDRIEEFFDDLKNKTDCRKIRVDTSQRMHNRIFLQFIAMILQEWIHFKMDETGLSKKYTLDEVMDLLKSLIYQTRTRKDGKEVVEYLKGKSAMLDEILQALGCGELL